MSDLTTELQYALTDQFGRSLTTYAGGLGNLVLGYENQATNGSIVVSSAVAGLGPEQLQNDQGSPATAWQTPTGATEGAILLQRPPGTRWRGFGLFRTNLTPEATVEWFVSSGGALVYHGVSDPVHLGYGQAVHVATSEYLGDAMQCNISDPTNPQGFLSVAQFYAGPLWQTARNYGYASAIQPEDSTTVTTTRSGAEYIRNDWIRRGFDLSLPAVAPNEVWSRVVDLDRFARRGGNVLFVPVPGGANQNVEAIFGRLKPTAPIGYANNSARTRSWRATITERL